MFSGLGIMSILLGIVSIILCWKWWTLIILGVSLTLVVLGFAADWYKRYAFFGLILTSIATYCYLVWFSIVPNPFGTQNNVISRLQDMYYEAPYECVSTNSIVR